MNDYFDHEYYLNKYEDLPKAGIITRERALLHWNLYGKNEGRRCSPSLGINNSSDRNIAVLFHVGSINVFDEIISHYHLFFIRSQLIFITVHSIENQQHVLNIFPHADVEIIPNKGCDIGGNLKNLKRFYDHKYHKLISFIYFLHTKTDQTWRIKMFDPILNNNIIIENDVQEKPIIYGSSHYTWINKLINMDYIKEIMNRYFSNNDYQKYFDNYEGTDLKKFFFNVDFYKYYERDLSSYSNADATNHWMNHGKNEFHRIHNPNKIIHFGEISWFVAGTCFACNHHFAEILKNIDLDAEFDILEEGYQINNIPRRTHAWEYLYGLLAYSNGGHIISVDDQGDMRNMIQNNSYQPKIYQKCNSDIAHYSQTDLYNHYQSHGLGENRIGNLKKLMKRQSVIHNNDEKIAFFLIIPCDAVSGGYRTLLNYIKHLEMNGIDVDLYFGNGTSDMRTHYGLSIMRESIEFIIQKVEQYGVLDIKKHNFFLGLNAQKKYDVIVANAWQIAEAVYLNKQYCNHIAYIIQDKEWLFYPNNPKMQEQVKKTYQHLFHYYCLSKYLFSEFHKIVPNSKLTSSVLGIDHGIYHNQFLKREKSIILAYYKGKPNRLPEMVTKIVNIVSPKYQCFVFPDFLSNATNLGRLTPIELNDIYNKATIGIIFSNSNPSRIGYEMIASGLRVIELDSEYTHYDMPDKYFTKIKNIEGIEMCIDKLMINDYQYPFEFVKGLTNDQELGIMHNFFSDLLDK